MKLVNKITVLKVNAGMEDGRILLLKNIQSKDFEKYLFTPAHLLDEITDYDVVKVIDVLPFHTLQRKVWKGGRCWLSTQSSWGFSHN